MPMQMGCGGRLYKGNRLINHLAVRTHSCQNSFRRPPTRNLVPYGLQHVHCTGTGVEVSRNDQDIIAIRHTVSRTRATCDQELQGQGSSALTARRGHPECLFNRWWMRPIQPAFYGRMEVTLLVCALAPAIPQQILEFISTFHYNVNTKLFVFVSMAATHLRMLS